MKKLILISLVTVLSIACYAQTDNIVKKDSSKFIIKPFNYYSFTSKENNPLIFSNYTSNYIKTSSRFVLFHDSLYSSSKLYDNYRHEYFLMNNDPLCPYHNFKTALAAGTLNYLFLLFDKK